LGALTAPAGAFSAASHKTSTLRSPAFASSMIVLAIISSVRSAWRVIAKRAISNAMPMRRTVSGSNLWPLRMVGLGHGARSYHRRERDWSLGHRRLARAAVGDKNTLAQPSSKSVANRTDQVTRAAHVALPECPAYCQPPPSQSTGNLQGFICHATYRGPMPAQRQTVLEG